jgi:Xaa-Pro aminopeptidase
MLISTLKVRRKKLSKLVDRPVLLWSGDRPSRNFPANKYPFRASSHFLYFAGIPIPNSAIHLQDGRLTLFVDDPHPGSALWHGESPTRTTLAQSIGADAAYPLSELLPIEFPSDQLVLKPSIWATDTLTVGLIDKTREDQCYILDRSVNTPNFPDEDDILLANAIVTLRSQQDDYALSEMRNAIEITKQSHIAGMRAAPSAKTEADIRAAMEAVIISHNMTTAYNSIVTVQGEVLHNEHYHNLIKPTDLILADVGAETQNGWAADVTRTWSASGKFSSTQRDLYNAVLAAHDVAIAAIKPGVEYQDIHLLACHKLAEGFVDLGILKGDPEVLVNMDAHALFFPHGVGHLLGLDVHDMEDLGDRAGYAADRERSDRFGLGFLRLHRPLLVGMVVTIEPGFYQVPAILNDPKNREKYNDVVNWERLSQFSDVRGIRIEDDVLVTERGSEVLTKEIPVTIDEMASIAFN